MTRDQEQAAALEDIARVRPAVEKLRELFAAAVAADRASGSTARPVPPADHRIQGHQGDDPGHPDHPTRPSGR